MGIQSRKTTAKKNNITVNTNIEDTPRPVKVVKQPKPVIVKQPKPVVKVVKQPKAIVPQNEGKVEELKRNANTFQKMRDTALKKSIELPQNFSAISDIRDKKI